MELIYMCLALIVIIGAIWYTFYFKNKLLEEYSQDIKLSGTEKSIVVLLELLIPLISGAIFYYGWKKRFPAKAKQANLYSFLLLVPSYILWNFISFSISYASNIQVQSSMQVTQQPSSHATYNNNSEFINQIIKQVKTSTVLPQQVDSTTTWVDVTAQPNAIRYHYILTNIDTDQITNYTLKNYLVTGICTNNDTRGILDRNIHMEYFYSVEGMTNTYFVSISKSDCVQ